ncbi:hypothetical protein HK098_007432 [Nowakowskiella sp. JEL0407]|nr:hypothetical protein HK098_007432 [Nowakowskiella sp. JEL0407]
MVIMKTAQDLLNAERCALFMVDKEKGELWSTLAQGAGEIRIPMTKGIAGHVAKTGEILNIPNAYKDARFNSAIDKKTGFHTRNILCMPMRNTEGEIIGVSQVINKIPEIKSFNKEDEMLLMAFSALAAVTIEKSVLFKALHVTLQETSKTKNFLSKILQNITDVVLTFDSQGKMTTINRPETLGLHQIMPKIKTSSYEEWLGLENQTMISDIDRVRNQKNLDLAVIAHDYEFYMNGIVKNVNYTIVPLEEDIDEKSSDQSSMSHGAVVVIQDISSEKRINNTLSRYMSPALVHQVLSDGASTLKGSRQKNTVMIANIRNFTALSETMDAQDVISLLNEHYTYIFNSITQEQGVLDKYIGDAVMGVFGLPFASENDAERAISCSLKIKEELEKMNQKNDIRGLPVLKMGIGIATGVCLSGTMGAPKRIEYGIVGESVNLAMRLELATKTYGSSVIICDRTREDTKNSYHLREIDKLVVKGRVRPVTIFEVLGPIDMDLTHDQMTSFICYELGLAEYRSQNWQTAIAHFRKAVQLTADQPAQTMMERCKQIIEGVYKVSNTWDGSWQ